MGKILWLLYLLCASAQAFVATPFETTKTISDAATRQTAIISDTEYQTAATTCEVHTTPIGLSISPLITIAPVTANLIEQRQECFNDQGFRVDCATWTGYYYTWGPSGNPYEGGPGQGGGGGGSGEGDGSGVTTVIVSASAARTPTLEWLHALTWCVGLLNVLLHL